MRIHKNGDNFTVTLAYNKNSSFYRPTDLYLVQWTLDIKTLRILGGNSWYKFCSSHIFSFGFWYVGHFSGVIFFPLFFSLAHLSLQKVNKDYVIFSYFCNFVAKSDQKPKIKNGMNETFEEVLKETRNFITKKKHYKQRKFNNACNRGKKFIFILNSIVKNWSVCF
jgi:hypothetical protein